MMKIHWNGFLGQATLEYPKEVAGFLFSEKPYSPEEEWHVFLVKNVAKSLGLDPEHAWEPDRKEMLKIKQKAIRMGLTKIGNVHTHPYPKGIEYSENVLKEIIQPSKKDLRFARRFNDVVRGILVVGSDAIYDILFHDKFGKKIDIIVKSEEMK